MPLMDDQVKAALDLKGSEDMLLTAPARWVDDENGEMMALGVGSIDGHERKERMATLHSLALLTLTRSITHQSAIPQYKSTAQTESQGFEPGIVNAVKRNEEVGQANSKPQSEEQQQQQQQQQQAFNRISAQDHNDAQGTSLQHTQNGTATPKPASESVIHPQYESKAPVQSAPLDERLNPGFNESHSDPAKNLTSTMPDGKPTGIEMPTRSNAPPLDRMQTEYVTPPSDPSEIPNKFP